MQSIKSNLEMLLFRGILKFFKEILKKFEIYLKNKIFFFVKTLMIYY